LAGRICHNGGVKRWWIFVLAGLLAVDALVCCFWWSGRRDHRFDKIILAAANRYGVEPALVKAVIWRESRFDPKARGKANETGLMQIRAATAKEWAEAEHQHSFFPRSLFDPAVNTQAGAWYLQKLLKRYARTDKPVCYALADYNAGRGNVLRWNQGMALTNSAAFLARMDFPGTRKYVEAVMGRYAFYRPTFPPKTGI
jgi:soluble lytic murein transglycosylase